MAWNPSPRTAENRGVRQRRRHPRVSLCTRFRLIAGENTHIARLNGHVLDLSAGGCAARVHAHLEPGIAVRVELEIDGDPVWLPGRIMWTKTRANAWLVGVRFEHVAPAQAELLRTYVASQKGRRIV
jgi:c-di-GMP-binding flagellar brake protein YcgR